MKPKLNIIDDYNVKRKVVASFTFSVNLANTISEDTNQGKIEKWVFRNQTQQNKLSN